MQLAINNNLILLNMRKSYTKLLIIAVITVFTSLDLMAQIGPMPGPSPTPSNYYALGYQVGCNLAQDGNQVGYANTLALAIAQGNYTYYEGVFDGWSDCQPIPEVEVCVTIYLTNGTTRDSCEPLPPGGIDL